MNGITNGREPACIERFLAAKRQGSDEAHVLVPSMFYGELLTIGPMITAQTPEAWDSLTASKGADSKVSSICVVEIRVSLAELKAHLKRVCDARRNKHGFSYLADSICMLPSDIVARLKSGATAYPLGLIERGDQYVNLRPTIGLILENRGPSMRLVSTKLHDYNGPTTGIAANDETIIAIGFSPAICSDIESVALAEIG